MMKTLTFSLHDVNIAKHLLKEANDKVIKGTREISQGVYVYVLGDYIHDRRHIKWAAKVMRWWREYKSVQSRYGREMGSAALGVMAIWSNLRQGISIRQMYRHLQRAETSAARYRKGTLTERNANGDVTGSLSSIRIRSKYKIHASRRGQVDLAETKAAQGRTYRPQSL